MPVNLQYVFGLYDGKIDRPIIAVETGCSFQWIPGNEQYLSTPCIAKLVEKAGGILYSLDINQSHIDICRSNLKKIGLDKHVEFILGDSVTSIAGLAVSNINFVWLDSLEDGDHAGAELRAITPKLSHKHIICVDDYGSANSVKWQKVGSIIANGYKDHGIFDTPTGLIVGCSGGIS